MFNSLNSLRECQLSDQPQVKRDHSLAANFSQWMPKHSIVNDTTKAVFAAYEAERLANAIARLAMREAK